MLSNRLPEILIDTTVTQLHKDTISKYGQKSQIFYITEQMGELIAAISQYRRNIVKRNYVLEQAIDGWMALEHACFVFNIPHNKQIEFHTIEFDKFVKHIGIRDLPFEDLCDIATKKYGKDKVMLQVVEELAETMVAISQYGRQRIEKEDILEEIEGSRLMIQHLILLLDFTNNDANQMIYKKMYQWHRCIY